MNRTDFEHHATIALFATSVQKDHRDPHGRVVLFDAEEHAQRAKGQARILTESVFGPESPPSKVSSSKGDPK